METFKMQHQSGTPNKLASDEMRALFCRSRLRDDFDGGKHGGCEQ
jgi:hypothetical protein